MRTPAVIIAAACVLVWSIAQSGRIVLERRLIDANGPEDIWLKTTGDLNGDKRPDLVAGGHKSGGLVWYQAPLWTKHVIASTGSFGTDGEIADVDLDGDNDLVVIEGARIIWLENPGWSQHVIVAAEVHDIEVTDLDRDGKPDVVARNQGAFNGRGDHVFLLHQEAPDRWVRSEIETSNGEGLAVADIDRDADMDIVVERVWLENPGRRAGAWAAHEYGPGWSHPHTFVAAADLNRDGRSDIALAPSEKAGAHYRISWFEAPADPRDGKWIEHVVDEDVEAVHHFLGAADFNRDGNPDLVAAAMQQGEAPAIRLYRNSGAGASWDRQVIAPSSSHSMRIVDVNNDRFPDLFGADWRGSSTVELWINRTASPRAPAQAAGRVFAVRNGETLLDGRPFLVKGLRVSNALISEDAAAQLIANLDTFKSYGVNTVSVFFMGSRFGDVRGYRRDGTLDPAYAARMGRIIEAADQRGMVVLVGCLYWGNTRAKWEAWTQREANAAVANTVRWLAQNNYRNVFIDVDNEGMALKEAGFDNRQLVLAAKQAGPSYVVGTNFKGQPPPEADLALHFSERASGKPYIQSEGSPSQTPTPGGYWGPYSKRDGLYQYINIGVYTPEMKREQAEDTRRHLARGDGYMLASTWLQCVPPEGPHHTPGGLGTPESPGILWWLEALRDLR